jgi:hypothetical protein
VSSDDQQTKILFTAPGDNRQWQQTYSAIYANDIINCAIEGIKQIEAQLAQEQYLASNQVLAKTANLDNADSAANPGDAKGQESRVYRYTGNHVSTDLVEMKSGRSKVMSIEPGAEVVICENLENSSPKIVYVKPALGADNWDGGVKARREDLQPLD